MFLRFTDGLVVHSENEAEVARSLDADNVEVEALPPHPPTPHRVDRRGDPATKTLLFFGLIRPYKGIDDLLEALVLVDDVRLMVCGELWGDRRLLVEAIEERGLGDRVELHTAYVPDDEVPDVFAACDALVLPYRSGTGSQNVLLGHQLGLPVIATDVAGFGEQIVDGVTGFVCPPCEPSALAAAIGSLYTGDRLEELRLAVSKASRPSMTWQSYLATLGSL
jgi:glycosyltransferase involved in cell wall biosynthesis